MKPYWISWYSTAAMGAWELHSPWWVSGSRCSDDALTICAAVAAKDEEHAQSIVRKSYDKQVRNVQWRFCEEKEHGWSPFSDRFPRAKWMKWNPPPRGGNGGGT